MANNPSRFRDGTIITTRVAEVIATGAAFNQGCSQGNNLSVVGIANAGELATQNLDESLPSWTLLDQAGNARTPQVSQYIGGGLGAGTAGPGTQPVELIVPTSTGSGGADAVLGSATLADLAVGWTAV